MLITIIIALIIGLVIIAIVANVMQQHKEKQEAERRQELAKYKAVVEETELVILNDVNVPISKEGFIILYQRVLNALKAMNQVSPNEKVIMSRIQDCQNKIEAGDFNAIDADQVTIPDNEKLLIAMIQGIKKYRAILRSEHNRGKIQSNVFMQEDKKVERLQLRINVESQMRRGKMAKKNNMTGSARQYFEKAMATLDAQVYSDEFIVNSKQELKVLLDEIAQELNAAKAGAPPAEGDEDNLDALFAPKKKW